MNCPFCGNENRPGAKFCRYCGQVITATLPQTTGAQPAPGVPGGDDPYATYIIPADELIPDQPAEASPSPADSHTAPTLVGGSTAQAAPADTDGEVASASTTPVSRLPEPAEELPPQSAGGDADQAVTTRLPMPAHTAGTVLADRYRITSLESEEEGLRLYQAEDLRLCWSCGAEQTDPDPRFCEMCGMELTAHPLVSLRETPHLPLDGKQIFHADGYTYQVEPGPGLAQPLPAPKVLGYFSGYASDTGRQREIDEDSVIVLQLAGLCNRCSGPTLAFLAVADGIGGQDAGEVASRTAIHALAETILQQVYLPFVTREGPSQPTGGLEDHLRTKLIQAITNANQAIIDLRAQSATGSNMGCTLTAALMLDQTCVVANVGDSRTYRLHGGQLTQITRDHSVVADMVENGQITSAEALTHEKKGVIYRCLGDLPELEIDTFMLELEIGDRLMLCCDGLWEMVPEELIEDILLQYADPQAACQRLITLANEAGGEDNISVIVVNAQSVT